MHKLLTTAASFKYKESSESLQKCRMASGEVRRKTKKSDSRLIELKGLHANSHK